MPRKARHDIAIPAPKEYGFAVYDIDTNKGLAGARVCRQWRDRLLLLGETDADGLAMLMLPWERRISTHVGGRAAMIAVADGYTWGGIQHDAGELSGTHPLREGINPCGPRT